MTTEEEGGFRPGSPPPPPPRPAVAYPLRLRVPPARKVVVRAPSLGVLGRNPSEVCLQGPPLLQERVLGRRAPQRRERPLGVLPQVLARHVHVGQRVGVLGVGREGPLEVLLRVAPLMHHERGDRGPV